MHPQSPYILIYISETLSVKFYLTGYLFLTSSLFCLQYILLFSVYLEDNLLFKLAFFFIKDLKYVFG